jgi:hypothetical protein
MDYSNLPCQTNDGNVRVAQRIAHLDFGFIEKASTTSDT